MARNLLESIRLLANVCRLLADRCVGGHRGRRGPLRASTPSPRPRSSPPLNRYIGYEEAAAIAKQSLEERKTIRQVVLERGHVDRGNLTLEQLDAALDVLAMTQPPR